MKVLGNIIVGFFGFFLIAGFFVLFEAFGKGIEAVEAFELVFEKANYLHFIYFIMSYGALLTIVHEIQILNIMFSKNHSKS